MEAQSRSQSTPLGRGGTKCIALALLPRGSYTRTPMEVLRGPRGESKQRRQGMALISGGWAQGAGKPGSSAQHKKKSRGKGRGIRNRIGWEGPHVRVGVLSPRHLYWRAPNSAPQPRWEWKWPTAFPASQVTRTLNLSSSWGSLAVTEANSDWHVQEGVLRVF